MIPSVVGNLLVASTLVDDPLMAKAVCLMVHQEQDGIVGVMLNRPIQPQPNPLMQTKGPTLSATKQPNRLEGYWESSNEYDLDDLDPGADEENYWDDPFDEASESMELTDPSAEQTIQNVTQTLGTVHFGGPLNGPVVAIHGSSEFAEAETGRGIYVAAQKPNLEAVLKRNEPYRLIVGHLGWHVEQLMAEIDAGYWHVLPATSDAVFTQDAEMWPRLIRRATTNSVARWLNIPDNPMASLLN